MPISFDLPQVSVKLSPMQRFSDYLQSRGKRFTPQRRRVLETVYSHHDHFDAEELLEHLRDAIQRNEVSRPTVYRTLSELVEAGILRRLQVTLRGRALYEHQYAYPAHDHLLCERCDRLIEFFSTDLERLAGRVANSHQFSMRGHRTVIIGICNDCRQADE